MADTTLKGRRSILKGALAAIAGTAVAFPAASALAAFPVEAEIITESPCKSIWRRYHSALCAHYAIYDRAGPSGLIDPNEVAPMLSAMNRAREAMEKEPVTSVEDLAFKSVVLTGYYSGSNFQFSREALAFLSREGV